MRPAVEESTQPLPTPVYALPTDCLEHWELLFHQWRRWGLHSGALSFGDQNGTCPLVFPFPREVSFCSFCNSCFCVLLAKFLSHLHSCKVCALTDRCATLLELPLLGRDGPQVKGAGSRGLCYLGGPQLREAFPPTLCEEGACPLGDFFRKPQPLPSPGHGKMVPPIGVCVLSHISQYVCGLQALVL